MTIESLEPIPIVSRRPGALHAGCEGRAFCFVYGGPMRTANTASSISIPNRDSAGLSGGRGLFCVAVPAWLNCQGVV